MSRWDLSPPEAGESFEAAPVGPLRDVRLAIGRFEAATGHAEITDRFRADRNALPAPPRGRWT